MAHMRLARSQFGLTCHARWRHSTVVMQSRDSCETSIFKFDIWCSDDTASPHQKIFFLPLYESCSLLSNERTLSCNVTIVVYLLNSKPTAKSYFEETYSWQQPSQLPKLPIIVFGRWVGICGDTVDQHHEDDDVMVIVKKDKMLPLTFDTTVMSNLPLFSKPWFLL